MSDYKLSNDHFAVMRTSHGITLNTEKTFIPYNINIIPDSKFEISEEINRVTYTGHLLDPFIVSQNAELKSLGNEGIIGCVINNNAIAEVRNFGTINALNNSGTVETITDIPLNTTTTIVKISGQMRVPVKSNLTGSIVFGGGDTSSAVTLKYDSAKDCMVFTYE